MNNANQTTTSNTFDQTIAEFLAGSEPVMSTWQIVFIVPAKKNVGHLRSAIETQSPGVVFTFTREVAESCKHQEVSFQFELPMSGKALNAKLEELKAIAAAHEGVLFDYEAVPQTASANDPTYKKAGRHMKLRTEFLTDAIELRISLAPYVLSWNECCDEQFSAGDKKQPSVGDREVEFELSSTAPKLDHMRWLLNQISDMHVPAESLHTAERYTGARLPYDLIKAMEPPVAVVKKMLATAKEVAEWRGKAGSLQQDLVTNLEEHLARKAG